MSEITAQFNALIESLGEKLGVSAGKLYPLLVRQSYIDGIANIFYSLICAAVIFVTVLYFLQTYVKTDGNGATAYDRACIDFEDALMFALSITLAIAAVVAFILIIYTIPKAVAALGNPEWYAIQKLITDFK